MPKNEATEMPKMRILCMMVVGREHRMEAGTQVQPKNLPRTHVHLWHVHSHMMQARRTGNDGDQTLQRVGEIDSEYRRGMPMRWCHASS
jgi:hypothetical protein